MPFPLSCKLLSRYSDSLTTEDVEKQVYTCIQMYNIDFDFAGELLSCIDPEASCAFQTPSTAERKALL